MSMWCCWARSCSAETQSEWSPLWLRFNDAKKEAGFVRSQKAFLLRRVRAVTGIGIVLNIITVLMAVVWSRPWDRKQFPNDLHREVLFAALVTTASIMPCLLMLFVFVSCSRLTERVDSAFVEAVTLLALVVVMVAGVLSAPANMARLKGLHVAEVLPYASDSRILLVIDGIVTAAHIGLPIRWFAMLPFEVVGVLLYSIVILIGGSEPQPYLNLAFLAGLVTVSSIGKRFSESGDRQAFQLLIQEKSLRCQAEFQLSQVGSGVQSEARELQVAAMLSGAMTTVHSTQEVLSLPSGKSAAAFVPSDRNLSAVAQLARIADLGRDEHWLISGKSIKLLPDEVLGRGGYGTVIKAIMSGILVAVKLPNKRLQDAPISKFKDICNEMRVLRHLRHPNIVSFHGAIADPLGRRLAVVLEFVKGVLLGPFILKGQRREDDALTPATTVERFQVLLGVCSALLHMHMSKPCIVHSDLKAENIMVEIFGSEVRAKLLDFGFASVVTKRQRPQGGTAEWMAPEVVTTRAPVKPSMDVYSFGHTINFVSAGMRPHHLTVMALRSGGQPPMPPRPEGCRLEPVCGPLADDCLKFDEITRPSTAEVYRRLLTLPQHVPLPGASPCFLEGLRTLTSEGMQDVYSCTADCCSSMDADEDEVLERQESGSEWSAPLLGMHLPELPAEALPEEDAAAESPESHPQPTMWKPCPQLPTTKDNAMLMSLLHLASRWNPELKRLRCCELHASVKIIQRLCSQLEDMDCLGAALLRPSLFCPECGLLAPEPGLCQFCGLQLQVSSTLDPAEEVPGQGICANKSILAL